MANEELKGIGQLPSAEFQFQNSDQTGDPAARKVAASQHLSERSGLEPEFVGENYQGVSKALGYSGDCLLYTSPSPRDS